MEFTLKLYIYLTYQIDDDFATHGSFYACNLTIFSITKYPEANKL